MLNTLVSSFSFWLVVGLVGQFCFFMRFFLQWTASEQQGESVIPVSFWWYSVLGSLLLLAYSIYRQDIVFIIGQTLGCFVYLRNIQLIQRAARRAGASEQVPTADQQ